MTRFERISRYDRLDERGAWFHVCNRAVASRTMFEDAIDMRRFESQLDRVVKRRLIEIHASCVLTTHFHLVVRSLVGRLAHALRLIESEYVLGFNARHDRDGPLVKGPFFSVKLFDDGDIYRSVRYVDLNSVEAGLARHAQRYAHGSAYYFTQRSRPTWLSKKWVERFVRQQSTSGRFTPRAYAEVFLWPWTREEAAAFEWSLRIRERSPRLELGPYDRSSEFARDWLRERCLLADGSKPGFAAPPPALVATLVADASRANPAAHVRARSKNCAPWSTILVGLLRDLACATFAEIARATRTDPALCARLYRRHATWLVSHAEYANWVGDLATTILARARPLRTGASLRP